jgi:VWFA-related protein
MRSCLCLLGLFVLVVVASRGDDNVVFKDDVALSRVDAQVVDRDGHAITGLEARDFALRVDGKVQPIRNFASESMPIDILLLLDVSGSMRPHVQRIADAAHQALDVLAPQDRIAILVFDTRARERLPFSNSRADVTKELDYLVRSERFNGGTRITTALIEAASYVQRHARAEARRAIVILTDDETQDSEDEPRVESALSRADSILSFLQAPYEPPTAGMPGGGRRRGGVWPGGGGGVGFPGGGGWPGSGGGWPGGPSHTAGTETIALDSGGDTMSVNDASALQDTLERLRQRYAIHFYMPGDTEVEAQHSVRLDLSSEARLRFAGADVRSRRVFMSGATDQRSGPVVVSHQTAPAYPTPARDSAEPSPSSSSRHRVAVNENSGPTVNTVDPNATTPPQQ